MIPEFLEGLEVGVRGIWSLPVSLGGSHVVRLRKTPPGEEREFQALGNERFAPRKARQWGRFPPHGCSGTEDWHTGAQSGCVGCARRCAEMGSVGCARLRTRNQGQGFFPRVLPPRTVCTPVLNPATSGAPGVVQRVEAVGCARP